MNIFKVSDELETVESGKVRMICETR